MKQMISADTGNDEIIKAIVVIIADGSAHALQGQAQPHILGNVGESAVVVVVVKRESGTRSAEWMSRPPVAIDQQDVQEAIVIVIDECAAAAFRFRKELGAIRSDRTLP